jgi:probable rRNA maturation factor
MPDANDQHVRISSTSKAMRIPRKRIIELVKFVARKERKKLGEVDIAFVTEGEISKLNKEYLNHRRPTDVLSFDLAEPFEEEEALSGQLIICPDVAIAQSRTHGNGPQKELLLYVVHGLLHLLDYDDKTVDQGRRMAARQEKLLGAFLNKS